MAILQAEVPWTVSPSGDPVLSFSLEEFIVRVPAWYGPLTVPDATIEEATPKLMIEFVGAVSFFVAPVPEGEPGPSVRYGGNFDPWPRGMGLRERREKLFQAWESTQVAPDAGVYQLVDVPWPLPLTIPWQSRRRFLVEGHDVYLEVLAVRAEWWLDGPDTARRPLIFREGG